MTRSMPTATLRVTVARAVLAGAALAAVLALNRPQPAQAAARLAHTLAALHAASVAYSQSAPPMGASIELDSELADKTVGPLLHNGSMFVPVVVEVFAAASDLDTLWIWDPWCQMYRPLLVVDQVDTLLQGPSDGGWRHTEPWNGAFRRAEYTTQHCTDFSVPCLEMNVELTADDAASYADDGVVSRNRKINVVVTNASAVEHVTHIHNLQYVHIGDKFLHSAFYLPPDASSANPAPIVDFSHYNVQEGDWTIKEVTGALSEDEVGEWFNDRKTAWNGAVALDANGQFPDHNGINRDALIVLYPSFANEGSIELRQGWHVKAPVNGPWWYNRIRYHFVGPDETRVEKQSYSRTSAMLSWSGCPDM